MENEKKSWWTKFKNFIKKILPGKKAAVTLGIAASAMGASMDKAQASDYVVERTDNQAVTDVAKELNVNPVDLKNLTINADELQQQADKRSNLEKTVDTLKNVKTGVNSVEDIFSSISNLGKSSSIDSTINNVESVTTNVSKAEETLSQLLSKPSVNNKEEVKKDEIATQKVSNEKTNNDTVQKTEKSKVKSAKKIKKAKTIKTADELETTSFDHIQFNPYDKEDDLSSKIVELKVLAGQAKYNGDMKSYNKIMDKANKLEAQRIKMTEARINDGVMPDVLENSPEYLSREYTPERVQKITAFRNLSPEWTSGEKIAVLSNGLTDLKLAISDCKKNGNPYVANELIKIYNETLRQRYEIAKEVQEHANDPKSDIHMPSDYIQYARSQRTDNVQKQVKTNKAAENVSISQMGQIKDLDSMLDKALAQKEHREAIIQDIVSETPHKKGEIDESKLANVSIGQMGTFENLDDLLDEAIEQKHKTSEKIEQTSSKNLKDGRVSISEMGKLNNIDDMLDKAIAKKRNNIAKINNYKANTGKLEFTDKQETLNKYFEKEDDEQER